MVTGRFVKTFLACPVLLLLLLLSLINCSCLLRYVALHSACVQGEHAVLGVFVNEHQQQHILACFKLAIYDGQT